MSKKVAYIDCFSGVAGDMLLAALIDAGVSTELLIQKLKSLTEISDEWQLISSRVLKSHGRISGRYVKVDSIYGDKTVLPPGSGENKHL